MELREWIKTHGMAMPTGSKNKSGKWYSRSYWILTYWFKTDLVRLISSATKSDGIKAGVKETLEKVLQNSYHRILLNHTCFVSESVPVPSV